MSESRSPESGTGSDTDDVGAGGPRGAAGGRAGAAGGRARAARAHRQRRRANGGACVCAGCVGRPSREGLNPPLCREPPIRHSAKGFLIFLTASLSSVTWPSTRQRRFFFKKNSLPSVPDLALGKDFFLENSLPSAPDTALGKDLIIFEMSLPSAPMEALGKEEIF